MADFLVSAVTGATFAAVATLLVLGSYFAARRLLRPGGEGDRTHEVAGNVAARIAGLHGLILALVYAQELDDYKSVRTILTDEAVAIADVYNDVARYGGPAAAAVQAGLARYLTLVVDDEWPRLGRGEGLSPRAWTEWEDVYDRLLALNPANDRQRYLGDRMRNRVTEVARFRQMREATAISRYSGLFWGPALIGLMLIAVPFYVYRPLTSHVILLATFGVYSGVILFFIYAFANPFANPGKLQPGPFQHLLRGEIGRSLAGP